MTLDHVVEGASPLTENEIANLRPILEIDFRSESDDTRISSFQQNKPEADADQRLVSRMLLPLSKLAIR